MANTYTQFLVHLVFSPKNRNALIGKSWREDLEKYMTKIIQERGHKLLALFAMPDHVHILIEYNVNDLIPKLIEDIKTSTNSWINNKKISPFKFEWQKGYGAFSHSKTQAYTVINYILNQETHHSKRSFKDEYIDFLNKNGIEFNNEYLFEFFNNDNKVL